MPTPDSTVEQTVTHTTPGPWRVEERFHDPQVVVLASIDERVIRVSVVVAAGGASSIEQQANARLIAAAPELLAALRLCRSAFGAVTDGPWSS